MNREWFLPSDTMRLRQNGRRIPVGRAVEIVVSAAPMMETAPRIAIPYDCSA